MPQTMQLIYKGEVIRYVKVSGLKQAQTIKKEWVKLYGKKFDECEVEISGAFPYTKRRAKKVNRFLD